MVLGLFAAVLLVLPFTFAAPPGGALPDPATESGRAIADIYWFVLAVSALVFLLVEGALILFIFRFRRRPDADDDAEGPQIHGNTRVEIAWTIVPALLLVAIVVFTLVRLPAVEAAPDGGDDAEEIGVRAHQFYWEYRYANGALSFDVLYLPVDRTASLRLTSPDVVHSWWVPELTGKRDAIPGRTNFLHFKPTRTGVFANGRCGEFCGIQHAVMRTRVEVLEQDEYERWLEDNAPPWTEAELAEIGEGEWFAACAKCHGDEGEGDIGPPIQGHPALTDFELLRRLLYEGQDQEGVPGVMPPVGLGWTDEQIQALIEYAAATPPLAPAGGDDGG